MPKPITELSDGKIFYIIETLSEKETEVPYIYLGLNEYGIPLIMRDWVASQRRMNATNSAIYDECEMDIWLENEETGFLSRFDEATRKCFVSTTLKLVNPNDSSVYEVARRCFCPTYSQLGYSSNLDLGKSFLNALETAKNTTDSNTARIGMNSSGSIVGYWLSSSYSTTQFRSVYYSGSAYYSNASYTNYYARPVLAVSPDTLVSDETEETIYLWPNPDKPYKELEGEFDMGSREEVPSSVRFMMSYNNLFYMNINICLNKNDDVPTWIDIPINEEMERTGIVDVILDTSEIVAENGCSITVKVYAKSYGKGNVTESVLLVV